PARRQGTGGGKRARRSTQPRQGGRMTVPAARFGALAALAALALPASAQAPREMVDTALVLAVDVSNSIDDDRYVLQMEGIAEAFQDPDVEDTILAGPHRAMYVTLVEWSNKAQTVVPWTLVTSREEAQAFAERLRHAKRADNQFTCLS